MHHLNQIILIHRTRLYYSDNLYFSNTVNQISIFRQFIFYFATMQQVPTLSEIAHKTSQSESQFVFSAIGCIVDITQPIYRQKEGNYIAEVKLVDESFNQFVQSTHLVNYLSVYLISQSKEELKLTSKIGDFVFLHKFMFSMWNRIKLRAKFYGSFECFYQVHCGQLQDHDNFHIQKKLGKENPSCDKEFIAARIAQLKNWLRINFRNVFHPFFGVKIINNYCSLIEPFSMLLKTHRFQKNEFDSYIFLKDTNGNIFYLDIKDFNHLLLREDQWVYIRGIKHISTDRQIGLTETGNIIQLPQIFAEQYETQAHYQAIYRKTSRITSKKKQSTTLTYISLFEQKPSTVKQLFDLQDKYKASSRKQDIILQNNYLVRGAVAKFKGRIKLYHTEYQMIVHDKFLEEITMQQKKQTIEDKKLVYVFEGTLYMIDMSIVSKREILKIKLFTIDAKSTFFEKEELQKLNHFIGHSDSDKKIEAALNAINSKLQKLRQLSSFQNPASLVLQPIRSDELIFRLINTKIA